MFNDEGHKIDVPNQLEEYIRTKFPMTPKQISERFELQRPIYYNLAKYGHFGFKGDTARHWEKTDLANEINELFVK